MQFTGFSEISGAKEIPSGFAHHRHRRPQPFKNTVVRIPLPSRIEHFWILNILPVSSFIDILLRNKLLSVLRMFLMSIALHPALILLIFCINTIKFLIIQQIFFELTVINSSISANAQIV
jgi:hypothetical protein